MELIVQTTFEAFFRDNEASIYFLALILTLKVFSAVALNCFSKQSIHALRFPIGKWLVPLTQIS